MALSANKQMVVHDDAGYGELVVASGVTIYKGALVGLVVGTGTVTNYNDASGHIPLGYAIDKVVGDGSLKIQLQMEHELVLKSQTITGVAAATDNGKAVYATDEATYTLTRPSTDAHVIGVVLYWRSSTTADLLLLGAKAAIGLGLAGGNKHREYLGTIDTTALEGTSSATLRGSLPLYGHGLLKDFYAYPSGYDSGHSSGSQSLSLKINSTAVTGGALSLSGGQINAAGDVGTKISATSITGANEFHDGDTLDVVMASGGTTFIAGIDIVEYDLWADVEYMAGA